MTQTNPRNCWLSTIFQQPAKATRLNKEKRTKQATRTTSSEETSSS
jgi:hypothetical protein